MKYIRGKNIKSFALKKNMSSSQAFDATFCPNENKMYFEAPYV